MTISGNPVVSLQWCQQFKKKNCLEVLRYILTSTQATSPNCFLLVCVTIFCIHFTHSPLIADVKRTERGKAAIPTYVKTVCVSVRER